MATLQSQYEQALARPTADAFAALASIHYIPTLTSIHGGPAVLKHLQTQDTLLKAYHKALNVIESGRSLCLEAETKITFLEGAGAYLPGLDDNFTTDRTARLPTVHVVSFDSDDKILQIRIFWDQASLLKSVEVIGSRANQWPIRDSQEQVRLVTSSVSRQQTPSEPSTRRQSRAGANGDPHTSLHLFEKPQAQPREPSPSHHNVAPRESAKPAPRDYHDLFAAGVEGQPADDRPASPIKEYHNAIKSGAGKNYQPIRLFDEGDEDALKSPERGIKTNPAKYSHFEFGEKPFEPQEHKPKHTKHQSQWTFEDFVTPQKPKARPTSYYPSQDRHFGWSDDEEEASKPNQFVQHVPAPRPDAETHFDFDDGATPKPQAAADLPIHGANPLTQQRAQGMYEDHVIENDARDKSGKEPLGNITNEASKAGHKKNFSSQFEIQDDSTGVDENAGVAEHKAALKKPEANARAAKHLESHWEMTDESPKVEHISTNIAGDGMGNRKTTEKSWWEYDE